MCVMWYNARQQAWQHGAACGTGMKRGGTITATASTVATAAGIGITGRQPVDGTAWHVLTRTVAWYAGGSKAVRHSTALRVRGNGVRQRCVRHAWCMEGVRCAVRHTAKVTVCGGAATSVTATWCGERQAVVCKCVVWHTAKRQVQRGKGMRYAGVAVQHSRRYSNVQ